MKQEKILSIIGLLLIIIFSLMLNTFFVETRNHKTGNIVDCFDNNDNKIIGMQCEDNFNKTDVYIFLAIISAFAIIMTIFFIKEIFINE
jgi:hypothetical protein